MLLGSNEVSLGRKVKEAILAVRIEQALPKERILELYLNEIYLGLQSYGVAAAAQTYFDKSLDQLTVLPGGVAEGAQQLQSVPLPRGRARPAGLGDRPHAGRPRHHRGPGGGGEGHAADPQRAASARQPCRAATGSPRRSAANWSNRFGGDVTTQGGLVVRTSLDPALQATADQALRRGLMNYDRSHGGWRGPVTHIETTAVTRAGWSHSLSALPRPPGMLPEWRLGVVLEETGSQAQLGWNDTDGSAHVSPMLLGDTMWARPNHKGVFGATPAAHGGYRACRRRRDGRAGRESGGGKPGG